MDKQINQRKGDVQFGLCQTSEQVLHNVINLLEKEVWWQENLGIHRFGLNKRKDLATVSRKKNKQPINPVTIC